jgi:coenzyme PQQ biosynthesis protein PqqD
VSTVPIDRRARPKLARKATLRWDRIEQRHMLLYPERGLALNPVAAAIVQRCDGAHTVAEIVSEIGAVFTGAARPEVERDVLELLDALHARCLLEEIS